MAVFLIGRKYAALSIKAGVNLLASEKGKNFLNVSNNCCVVIPHVTLRDKRVHVTV